MMATGWEYRGTVKRISERPAPNHYQDSKTTFAEALESRLKTRIFIKKETNS